MLADECYNTTASELEANGFKDFYKLCLKVKENPLKLQRGVFEMPGRKLRVLNVEYLLIIMKNEIVT